MSRSLVRWAVAGVGLLTAVFCTAAVAHATADIADCFRWLYGQQVVGGTYAGPLDFLRDAASAHADSNKVLKARSFRTVVVDRANGYLRIDDGATTDQTLTMAIYRKADSGFLVVAGSSNCADACSFAVEFFAVYANRLQAVPRDAVLPAVAAVQFIRPGRPVPKAIAAATPSINYLPARVGATLTLKPWYGYEIEEQMNAATRAAIRNVVLDWDAKQGRFVESRGGA